MSTTVTPEFIKYHIPVFWDDEYCRLDYVNESFNDPASVELWTRQGYTNQFTGDMCDMRSQQPVWNKTFLDIYTEMGWKDIGTSYYRMSTGTVLPMTEICMYVISRCLICKDKNIAYDEPLCFWMTGKVDTILKVPRHQSHNGGPAM